MAGLRLPGSRDPLQLQILLIMLHLELYLALQLVLAMKELLVQLLLHMFTHDTLPLHMVNT